MKRVLLTAFVLTFSLVLPPRLFERFWMGQERAVGQTLVEPLRSGMGRAGLLLFLILLSISAYVLIAYPSDFGKQEWNNPEHWADNPKVAAPSWTRLFDGDRAKHQILESTTPSQVISKDSGAVHRYQFQVESPSGVFPSFVSFSVSGIEFEASSPLIELYFRGGDKELLLHRHVVPGPRQEETAPILRYQEVPYRVNLTSDLATRKKIEDFLASLSRAGIEEFSADILVHVAGEGDGAQEVRLVFGGDVYGLLGTDTIGRDVLQGILAGLPIALLIALAPTLIASVVGASLGAISGYFGGIVDTLIQRIIDVIVSIPVLPILIFLTFIFGPKLSNIILILAAFGWTGLAIQLRPMVLQIRASGFIDYLRAKGFGGWRIIFRHVLPQTFPFILAYFILAAPGAILAEAGLSFLGLGDPSLVTWGQMLQQGYGTGAVYLGYWWWIIPPGAMIVITALAFFMLSVPLEAIATPRLRRE